MSQQQTFTSANSLPGIPNVEFVAGNDAVAVPPNPVTHIINIIGDLTQGVSTSNSAVNTEKITVANSTAAATGLLASKGVSSFNSRDFTDVSGFVSLTDTTDGIGQTIGAVTADIITFALGAVPGTYAIEVRVSGFDAGTPSGVAFKIFGSVRTMGAAGVLLGVPDVVSQPEVATATALANIVVSGNNVIVRVTGVALLTIDWGADLEYTFRS